MTIGLLELKILSELAEVIPRGDHDGAAFMRAIDSLRAAGYIDERGDITPAGREALLREWGVP